MRFEQNAIMIYSKLLESDLMRIYHGTEKKIEGGKFSLSKALSHAGNDAYGSGIYFGMSRDTAVMYAEGKGYIYHVDFEPRRLINDLSDSERRAVAGLTFDSLTDMQRILLATDWSDDGANQKQTKNLIIEAVMCEVESSDWLAALQSNILPDNPGIINKILSGKFGLDGVLASMSQQDSCMVVINDQVITIRGVESMRKSLESGIEITRDSSHYLGL